MKIFVCVFLGLVLVGCGAGNTKPYTPPVIKYSHPEHGVVAIPHEAHKKAMSDCRSEVYSKGATIDGEYVKDVETIRNYIIESLMFDTRHSEMKLRKLLADTGGKPLSEQTLNHDPSKTEDYYFEAKRLSKDVNSCMEGKGWKKMGLVS